MFLIVCTLALFERICSEDLLATFRSAASVPEKLTSLYEFDVDMPLRNSISGAADAVLVGATADIGVDSTDEGQIIVSKSGHIKVAPNVPPVAPYGRANNFTILLDARFSNMGKYTSLFQLQPENQDDGDAWFKIADGTFFGISAHGYIGVDDYRDNYCRFVVSIDNVNKVARYYVNGRLVIEAIGARCGACVEDGKFSFGETILLFTDNDGEEADVRATTVAFWSESLSPNAVASLGPPSFGAADAPLCAAMDELGTFLIWGLPALSQSNPSSGIARCGNTCCRSDGMLPCRYRDARFQVAHGPSGECQLNPSKGVCSVGQQVSIPNLDKDGYGYFCSAHVSSPAPAMEPLIGFLGGSEPEHHLASTIAFHLSIKAFQNGIVIPRDEIHPSLLEIFAASMIARTSGSTSEPFIFSQQTAYEWGFAPGQRQRTAFLLAQNVTPVVSKNGSHFVMTTMADISVFRRDRQIPAPLAIITGSGIDYCGAVARAVEQGQKTAMVSSACAGSSMTTQVRSVSSGPSANCRQWKLLLGSLGISKFGVLWSRTRLESFYYETFNVLGIRSCLPQCRDRLAGTNGSLCLAMSVEVCSQIVSSDTSSTCQAMADALKELRDADVRVILVGLEGRSVDYGEFFDKTHYLGMTGGQYLWMFMADTTSSSPLPKMAFLQRPGFAEHFDGSLLLVNTCDGSKWEQLQEYLNTLTADEFPDGLMNSGKKVPGGATFGVLNDATEGFAQYSWYFQESIDAFIARTVDATWALLLALNSLVRRYGHALYELIPSMILAEMDQLDFLGVCGHARWVGGSRSTATPIRVYNVRHVNESFEAFFFAGQMYNFVADPLAKVNDSGIMWYQEPRYFANSTSPPLHLPPDCKAGQESRHDLQCHPCPAGEYSPVAGRGIKCISCQPGHYNGALGQKSCSACPSGRYQSTVGQTGCSQCEHGRFAAKTAQVECPACFPGTWQAQLGQSMCKQCEVGRYTSMEGSSECTLCSYPLSTYSTGAISFEDCKCSAGSYAARQNGSCLTCPRGLSCEFGSNIYHYSHRSNKTLPYPKLLPGYWSSIQEPVSVFYCKSATNCPGGDPDTCGPNLYGQGCTQCVDGFHWTGADCMRCPSSSFGMLLFPISPLVFTPGLILVMYALFHDPVWKWGSWENGCSAALFVLLNYYQILSLLAHVTPTPPSPYEEALTSWGWTTDILGYLQLDCQGFRGLEVQMAWKISGPIFIGFVCFILLSLSRLLQRTCKKADVVLDSNRTFNVFFSLIYSFFTAVVALCFFVLNCVRHPNEVLTLTAHFAVNCFDSGPWITLVGLALGACSIYVVGFGTLFTWAICVAPKHFKSEGFQVRWKFLFIKYRPQVFWWSLSFLAKTFFLNVAFVLFTAGVAQLYWVMTVVVFYTGLVWNFSPYRHSVINSLEVFTGVTIVYGTSLQTWFVDREEGKHDHIISVVGFTISAMPIFAGIMSVAVLAWTQCVKKNTLNVKRREDLAYALRAAEVFTALKDSSHRDVFWEGIGDRSRWHIKAMAHVVHSELLGNKKEHSRQLHGYTQSKEKISIGLQQAITRITKDDRFGDPPTPTSDRPSQWTLPSVFSLHSQENGAVHADSGIGQRQTSSQSPGHSQEMQSLVTVSPYDSKQSEFSVFVERAAHLPTIAASIDTETSTQEPSTEKLGAVPLYDSLQSEPSVLKEPSSHVNAVPVVLPDPYCCEGCSCQSLIEL